MSILYSEVLDVVRELVIDAVGTSIPVDVYGVNDQLKAGVVDRISIQLDNRPVVVTETSANSITRKFNIKIMFHHVDRTNEATEIRISDVLESIATTLLKNRNHRATYGGIPITDYSTRSIAYSLFNTEVF